MQTKNLNCAKICTRSREGAVQMCVYD